jgi:hypothetical protein
VHTYPPLCANLPDAGQPDFCVADGDCADAGTGFVCGNDCEFPHGGAQLSKCQPPCAHDSDCGPGLACATATHHCQPASCTKASDCGTANFTCTGGTCAAIACTADNMCANTCVNGACSATIGVCEPAVP